MEIFYTPSMPLDSDRPDWHNYFLGIAEAVSERATCPRLSVGCVITHQNRIVATGYNGAPSSKEHCTEAGCIMNENHCIRAFHAERNAVISMGIHGIDPGLKDMKAYVTHKPCNMCICLLGDNGIEEVYYIDEY